MTRLLKVWDDLQTNLWLIPTLIVLGAVALAIGLIEVDGSSTDGRLADRWPRVFGAGAEGSRGLLSAIAGSMITVAGVTFSITMVALTMASSQYTSRILRNFMRDRANQTVLGVFVGVFIYCLVVLRTIRGGDEGSFVPGLAVFAALVLAFVAIGFLIFFVHHISDLLQATTILASAAKETLLAVDRLFPKRMGESPDEANDGELPADVETRQWSMVRATKTGYVQAVDADALLEIAGEADAIVRMEIGIGEFVIEGGPLASVSGGPADDDRVGKLNAAYLTGRHRTVHQDAGYGVRQIVDVALKALSPGINDTTTAIICIDHLAAILTRIADRQLPSPYRFKSGQLRVIARGPTFLTMLADAFDQIRQNADGNVAVLKRLLEVFATLAARTDDESRTAALRDQAELVKETTVRTVPSAHDRETILSAAAV